MIALFALLAVCLPNQGPTPVRKSSPNQEAVPNQARGAVVFDAQTTARILQHSPLPPPPPDPTNHFADDENAALLGQALFFDPRASKNGQVSCATCHDPKKAFSDGLPLAHGMGDGLRNAPSLYNVAWQRWLFWDGRADSTWAQALQPMENATELGTDRATLVGLVTRDATLRARYERVFGPADASDVDRSFANLGKSLAAYERKLVSNDSPFDRFARALRTSDAAGIAAYPDDAKRGLALFEGRGDCRLCHSGPLFSDGEFHDIGVPSTGEHTRSDPGRHGGLERLGHDPFRASSPYSDAPDGDHARDLERLARTPETFGQIRTPSLRNVALTAPYMDEGQMATLDDVLHFYSTRAGAVTNGHHVETILRPLDLTAEEIADLKAFLATLTDVSLPEVLRGPPPLEPVPPSGERAKH